MVTVFLFAVGWTYILEKHGGRLPLRIKAVREGTVVPTRNGMFIMDTNCIVCVIHVVASPLIGVVQCIPIKDLQLFLGGGASCGPTHLATS